MDPLAFMLTPLSMSDVEYQLWKGGIAYAERPLGDQNYDEFNEGHLMPPIPIKVCTSSFPFFSLFFLHIMYVITLRCGECFRVRSVQLPVVLLILLTCLGWFMHMVWMWLLESILWSLTLMSWVIPFLREHRS